MVGVFLLVGLPQNKFVRSLSSVCGPPCNDCRPSVPGAGFKRPDAQGLSKMAKSSSFNPDPDRSTADVSGISQFVQRQLQDSTYSAIRQICFDLELECDVVHLSGSVPSYYQKQVAQALVDSVEGVHKVDNQIKVVPSNRRAGVLTAGLPSGANTCTER
jgi:hypothetical protein